MRARPLLAIALASLLSPAVLLAGCGNAKDDSTPVACLEGSGAYMKALAAAPGEATLADGTPISDCLAENQAGGDLATVGEAMVETATKLNAEARAEPSGPAPARLGYLLGAAERGASSTEGIHTELIRRLTVAARYSPRPPLPAHFQRAYQEGFDAGRDHG